MAFFGAVAPSFAVNNFNSNNSFGSAGQPPVTTNWAFNGLWSAGSVPDGTQGDINITNVFLRVTTITNASNSGSLNYLRIFSGNGASSSNVTVITSGTMWSRFGLQLGNNSTLIIANTSTLGNNENQSFALTGGTLVVSNGAGLFLNFNQASQNTGTIDLTAGAAQTSLINYGQNGGAFTNTSRILKNDTGTGAFFGVFGGNNFAFVNTGTMIANSGTLLIDPRDAFSSDGFSNSASGFIQIESGANFVINRTANAWDTDSDPDNYGHIYFNGGTMTVHYAGAQASDRGIQNFGTLMGSGTLALRVRQNSTGSTVASNGILNIFQTVAGNQQTFTSDGGGFGTFRAASGGTLKINGNIASGMGGNWNVASGGTLEIASGINADLGSAFIAGSGLNGTIKVNSGANFTLASATAGAPTLNQNGTFLFNGGTISMPNVTGLGRFTNSAGATLINDGNGVFRTGYGVGQNNYSLLNLGSIIASNGNLTVYPDDAATIGGFQNQGLVRAMNGGTFTITRSDNAWFTTGHSPTNLGGFLLEGGTIRGSNTTIGNLAGKLVNASGGTFTGSGTIQGFTTIENNGTAQANGGTLVLGRVSSSDAFFLVNRSGGVITGNTANITIEGVFTNQSGGILAGIGNTTVISNSLGNAGAISLSGASLEVGGVFINQTGGTITLASSSIVDSRSTAGLTNDGAIWITAGSLYVTNGALNIGMTGSGQLTISNGLVRSSSGVAGYNPAGSNSIVLVAGSSSLWTNSGGLIVGRNGAGNQLIITNGGRVFNTTADLGSVSTAASNNTVLVTGTDSEWVSSGILQIGGNGAGNRVVVSNNGELVSLNSTTIGQNSSNNSVHIVDGGSWRSVGTVAIGRGVSGVSNMVTIAGGTMLAGGVIIGELAPATNNVLRLESGSLFVTNVSGTAELVVSRLGGKGELIMNGGLLTVNRLLATNGLNSVVTFNGGTVISRGTTVSNFQNFVVGDTGSGGATFIANGGTHRFTNNLYVGNQSGGNALVISNGASFVNNLFTMGSNTTSTGNSVLVTGSGSTLSNRNFDLRVGFQGGGNQFEVNSGGAVFDQNGYVGGYYSSNNVGTVTGSGSVWRNSSYMYVSDLGASNKLVISNGGVVSGLGGVVGNSPNVGDNVALITGANSVWSNSSFFAVGFAGSGNQVTVTNGGMVITSTGQVGGSHASSTNNTVTVTGLNSAWMNSGNLAVGEFRGNNSFLISAGGQLQVGGKLVVGATNLLSVSSGSMTVSGIVTNRGTISFLNSVGTFNSAVVNQGAWITDPTTNIFNGTYTVADSGYLSAAAGDVFMFRSNLVNQSTNNVLWDTFNTTAGGSGAAGTKFIFDGTNTVFNTGYTQEFYTAGVLMTGGFVGTPSSVTDTQQVSSFAAVTGFVTNFALDRLEIGNAGTNSTLSLFDTFGTVSPSDGNIAALFVNDLWITGSSKLILNNNTRLYFVNSNNWSSANYTLLGNAELHQLVLGDTVVAVPEPNVLLLWLGGVAMVYYRRRKKRV